MIHVFLLMVYLGVGDDRRLVSNDMYFRSVIDCNFYAAEISKRYGSHTSLDAIDRRDRVTAYCLPKYMPEGAVNVY